MLLARTLLAIHMKRRSKRNDAGKTKDKMMTFKIILTCLFFADAMIHFAKVGMPREPITLGYAWGAALAALIAAIAIYGIWKWI